jgi:hypothetical protein
MEKISIVLASACLLVTVSIVACNSSATASTNREGISELPAPVSQDSLVSRGRYLVNIMGCNDCHTPMIMTPQGPQHDSTRMLSGHPAAMQLPPADLSKSQGYVLLSLAGTAMTGPWGTSFAANLTSDATGIGNWTEAQFFKAIREGKYKGMDGNRSLLPPMPWPAYAQASDDDLHAIFAYLKSTPPVDNRVPAPLPPAH